MTYEERKEQLKLLGEYRTRDDGILYIAVGIDPFVEGVVVLCAECTCYCDDCYTGQYEETPYGSLNAVFGWLEESLTETEAQDLKEEIRYNLRKP